MAPGKHVLVVDDDGDVADVICQMLEEHGYHCSTASGGISMRHALTGDGVDAIILDSLMPGEASAALALHAKSLRLAVVMISGNHEMMKFAQDNGLQLLHKPFRYRQLLAALDEAFASGEFGQRKE